MQTGTISFCNKTALNIKSTDIKNSILQNLENEFDIKIINKHHEIFSEEFSFKKLNKVPFLLSTKTNGNPYFLYCTRINFTNTVIIIDKKIQQITILE